MSLTVLHTNVLHCDDVYSLRVLYYEALDNHIGWDDYVIQNIKEQIWHDSVLLCQVLDINVLQT